MLRTGTVARRIGSTTILAVDGTRQSWNCVTDVEIGTVVEFETDEREVVTRLRVVGQGWQSAIRQAQQTIADRVGDASNEPGVGKHRRHDV